MQFVNTPIGINIPPNSPEFPSFTILLHKSAFGKQKKTAQPKLCGFGRFSLYFTFSQKRMSIAATSARVASPFGSSV